MIDIHQLPDPWVDLTCSFSHTPQEYKELDLKWYFSTEEEPFLQWVPSSGRKPQTIGQRFKNRLEVTHSARNTSEGSRISQIIRVLRPSVHLSGDYTCKVASFFMEESSAHNLIIFGKIPMILDYVITMLCCRPWPRPCPVLYDCGWPDKPVLSG